MGPFRIHSAGDAAVVVELPEAIDPEVNAWCVALSRALTTTLGTIARDVVIGYCSVTVFFDPLAVDAEWLEAEIAECAATIDVSTVIGGGAVEVPVCYGGDAGPDLADVAAFAGCSEAEVIALHACTRISRLPGRIRPRLCLHGRGRPAHRRAASSHAKDVRCRQGRWRSPAGQTGVYPSVTPGGWNIIGRTPLKPYDPARTEPFLFRPGDRVRFRPLDDRESANGHDH